MFKPYDYKYRPVEMDAYTTQLKSFSSGAAGNNVVIELKDGRRHKYVVDLRFGRQDWPNEYAVAEDYDEALALYDEAFARVSALILMGEV